MLTTLVRNLLKVNRINTRKHLNTRTFIFKLEHIHHLIPFIHVEKWPNILLKSLKYFQKMFGHFYDYV